MKLQTLTLAAKLLVFSPSFNAVLTLASYALSLGLVDPSPQIRDKAKFLAALLGGGAIPDLYDRIERILNAKQQTERDTWDEPVDQPEFKFQRPGDDIGGVKLRREQVKVVLGGAKTLSIPIYGENFTVVWLRT